MSLYDELGGAPAIRAALDRFYEKVLADGRMRPFFDETRMESLKDRQAAFLAMAFGGPNDYQGRDLRRGHEIARRHGLDESVFELFMANFRSTLEELGVAPEHVAQVMDIAYSGKEEVLAT